MMRVFLALLMAACAFPQNPGDSFFLVRLVRRTSGPTVDPVVIQPYRNGRAPVDVLGLKSLTGTQQVWLVEAHGSFASLEATDSALTSAGGQSSPDDAFAPATLIALLRPGLSYRPDEAIKALPTARFFQVTFFRTRPGTAMDFAEVIRIRNAALDYVNVDRPEIGYQVISGAPSGTYVFFSPMTSLRALDNAMARTWGNPDSPAREARQATSKTTMEADITREQLLFRVEPRISFVSESFAAAAPDFWHGRK